MCKKMSNTGAFCKEKYQNFWKCQVRWSLHQIVIFFYKQTRWYYKPYLQEQQIVMKTRFSISSLHIGFGKAFPQNSRLWIRRSIKNLFNLTHSDNVPSSTLSVVTHFLTYSWTNFVLHFKSVVPIAVVSGIYAHKRLCFGDYHDWLHLDLQLWYVQMGYILEENGNN